MRANGTRLAEGNILRAPVPAAMTPRVDLVTQQYQTTTYDVQIYKITTKSGPLRLRSETGTKYKILGKYKKGKEVIILDKTTSSWYEVTAPDGKHARISSITITVQYENATVWYRLNGSWLQCAVYYRLNGAWVRVAPYYRTGGAWVQV